MSQTTEGTPVTLVQKKSIDLHVDETPSYPEDLKPFPKNYFIPREKGTERNIEDVNP